MRALGQRTVRVKGSDLAELIDTTPGFVAQVMTPLVRAGWVASDPGPTGGYRIAVELDDVSVLDVIELIEGPTDTGQCVLVDRPCDPSERCALHAPWSAARDRLLRELSRTPLSDVRLDAR